MPPTYKYMANVLREELTKCEKDNQRLEARCAQLEEGIRKIRVHAASRWILDTADAALSPSEPRKEE